MAGKVLIVDDISANRLILKVKLSAARYEAHQAGTGAEAIEQARKIQPDIILLDIALPDFDGFAVCRRLKADPLTRDIPVIMVTAQPDDSARVAGFRAGADDVFGKPLDDLVLLARLRSLLRARETSPGYGLPKDASAVTGMAESMTPFEPRGTVALVCADHGKLQAWRTALEGRVGERITLHSPAEALDAWDHSPAPDLILIPANLSGSGDGLFLMSELRSRAATRFTAICIAADPAARETVAMALDLGAFDVIPVTSGPEELAVRLNAQVARKRRADRLRASVEDSLRLSMTDALTGLHNRRFAFPQLSRIAAEGRPFAVMLLDIDRFKQVNDTFGHAAGDAVLTEVARRFRANLRSVDLIARIGGEEFLVALPSCSLDSARATAERLRHVIGEYPVVLSSGQSVTVTVSAGLAMSEQWDASEGGVDRLIDRADRALLAAKADGRNQVTISRSAA